MLDKKVYNLSLIINFLRQILRLKHLAKAVYALVSIAIVLKFTKTGLGNDFEPFYIAGVKALNKENPWIGGADSVYSAYVNGPLTLLIVIPLSILDQESSLLLSRIISVICIPLFLHLLGSFVKPKISRNSEQVFWLSSIFLFSYPVRSNLEYGQLFIIVSTLIAFSLKSVRIQTSLRSLILPGLALCLALDYKPQVFLPLVIITVFLRPKILLIFPLGFMMSWSVSYFLTGSAFYASWFDAIKARKEGGFLTIDQMNLYAISPSRLVVVLTLLVITFFLILFLINNGFRWLIQFDSLGIIWLFWLLTIPYLHPTDLLFAVGLTFLQFSVTRSRLLAMSLGCGLVWSNSASVNLLVLVAVSLYILARHKNYLHLIWIPSIFFILGIFKWETSETIMRQSFNYFCLLFLLAHYAIYTSRTSFSSVNNQKKI